ncbi:hypothetical protein [Neisseria sp. Marseille-Q6792]|uniref:hypothetical protein n=1 Tax=Neisseria sp. Marseille-Q6792 TaxID=2937985 RepID=UPI0020256D26|nr:hypothetical protein [Neisseria sp. Marseille-Q6792]
MPSEGSDGIGFGIGTGKGLSVWQSASGNRIDKFAVLIWWIKFKSGQGDEAADSTDSTARRGNAVLV